MELITYNVHHTLKGNLDYFKARFALVFILTICFSAFLMPCSVHAQIAAGKSKFLGNIGKGSGTFPADYETYWNQVTPENAGKWGPAEPTRDQMNWAPIDAMVDYADAKGFSFKQHAFVWGSQEPSWISGLSAADQKAEVEEWMQLFSQRYGDRIDLIDVVNEPLHAKPSYRNAIGGDNGLYGTGWDWVIWSFEKARQYFPNAKLILNDYDILKSNSATTNYLTIINLLKERGLIDGIGEQAHFLESTSLTTIQSNLDRLTATGIPVYISEFDLNIADDAAQKNRYEQLFPIFWNNAAVKGVTLWGYRQGSLWRPDAYLIRSDGSERPAMTWLKSFVAGQSSGELLLQAENFSAQQGITKYSDIIAYVDAGDWVRFDNVNLGNGLPNLEVRYSKGSSGTRSVAIREGSTTGTLLGTVTINPTGGWNTFTTATTTLTGATGIKTLYFVFQGGSGVGNFDWFRFTPPATIPDLSLEAENHTAQQGITKYSTFIGYTDTNDWVRFDNVNLSTGYSHLEVRYSKGITGARTVEVRDGSTTGTLLGTLTTNSTGSWNTYTTESTALTGASGSKTLYFVFKGGTAVGNFDWFKFTNGGSNNSSVRVASTFEGPVMEKSDYVSMHIFPNPAREKINIELFSDEAGQADAQLLNSMGGLQTAKTFYLEKGLNVLPWDLPTLSPGLYILNVQGGQGKHVKKVLLK